MDLMDAVLVTRSVSSFAELSLSPVFRRRWPSIYEALQDCRPPRQDLMKLYIQQMPTHHRILLAGDHTPYPRLYASTLQDRTYEHGSNVIGSPPITLGHGYSTIAWLPEAGSTWALPLRHERITSYDNPLTQAAFQLRQVCQHLPTRPLSLWDSEYGCAPFLKMTADIPADKILRLRPNRCLWTAPPPPVAKRGRPRKHGDKFSLTDPTTWPSPVATLVIEDSQWGILEVKHWTGLHMKEYPDIEMELILIQRKGTPLSLKAAKPIWLACLLEEMLPLTEFWPLYAQRFQIDHWNRFAKQRLHWTLPKLATPEQEESWSDLMPLLTWQLWLAREIVQDYSLPWQKPISPGSFPPGRVAQGFSSILAVIGTPACEPKPRGKSPGWLQGKKRTPRIRYPTVKKRYSPAVKNKKKRA